MREWRMSFADRLAVSKVPVGAPCMTCNRLRALSAEDWDAYTAAVDSGEFNGAQLARALELKPSTYRTHVLSGHVVTR